jgi:hypothetical protein
VFFFLKLQKRLFSIDADEFGDGKVLFEWSPRGELLACAGTKVSTGKQSD